MNKGKIRKILIIVGIIVVLWALESAGYFLVAIQSGLAHGGPSAAVNLQLPIDRIIPWWTPIFALYIPLPYIWIIWFPIIALLMNGKKGFAQYSIISLIMYIAGILIYWLMPTVTIPHDFVDGTIQTLPSNSMFFQTISDLDSSPLNVFGSFPSYHNFWAGLCVLFGIIGLVNAKNRTHKLAVQIGGILFIIYGLAISVSTLVLHQHAILDFVFTYIMVAIFYFVMSKFKWDEKLT
ncbi:MAG: hypothetical protein LBM13_01795, partial [Candidatus Ancillula sp.]|nr:hypothetical protein [Candidatus Ancillula sp.]